MSNKKYLTILLTTVFSFFLTQPYEARNTSEILFMRAERYVEKEVKEQSEKLREERKQEASQLKCNLENKISELEKSIQDDKAWGAWAWIYTICGWIAYVTLWGIAIFSLVKGGSQNSKPIFG